jgi:transcriptional regulator with XRE-family HTH domain
MVQERMKSLRLEAKLTQKEIAEKLGISTAIMDNGKQEKEILPVKIYKK